MSEKVDILINGGGVGGATAAYYLARAGLKVVLVEQRDQGSVVNGADLLKPSGIQVLKKLDILDDIFEQGGQKRNELAVFHDSDRLAFLDYRQFDDLGYFVLIPYEKLRNLLWDKLMQLDHVKMHFNSKISAISADDNIIREVSLNNGESYQPKVVIGADGSGSYMRRWMSIDAKRSLYQQKMYLACFPMVASVKALNRLYVDNKQGLAYFYPISKNESRLVIGFPENEAKDLLRDNSAETLKKRLREFVSESDDALDEIKTTQHFKGIPITYMHAQEYCKGNVALLGNAIHNVHPITGQGMNLAIEDAGELGACLVKFFQENNGLHTSLNNYFNKRFPINDAIVRYGHSLAMNFHSKHEFEKSFNLNLQGSGRRPHIFQEINKGVIS